ncbi:holo-ACP synthase [Aerococcus suis]|uniref:Holo-[acyl-carrier-protein] synthase n=1 Tax=Aerococcus suis TaxID=371602 RepID=A0A1W1YRE7_9LACT|nr:holo-ACP synthase [Aerococcus suis]MCI7239786.1 holo-ACP synthase [Aerococcus suis]MDD7758222.1 holo-ACP synthase [Aerococcus suis]MDY4646693.1 holo-ACP synthase [Aerococcus suis]SMC38767.1 holo-[acyl-carrier-protein] synthase [Aerococcus suis]
MIYGIGIDLVELDRIEQAMQHSQFLRRVLTVEERKMCSQIKNYSQQVMFVAGRWAAKEAYAKALGTGIGRELTFQDIETYYHNNGQPQIVSSKFKGRAFVSIAHHNSSAVAEVILEQP